MSISNRPLRYLWLAGVVTLFTTGPAYPWGSKGHEIVAAIAETTSRTLLATASKNFSLQARR